MATSRLPDQKAITLLEDNICRRELTLSWKLAEGMNVAAEEAALTELYRTLRVAHMLRAVRTHGRFLRRFP